MVSTPRDRGDFEIAVICALELEAECVYDVLDKIWDDKKYGRASGDENAYTLGMVGGHNLVLVHLPGMGTNRAAFAAAKLQSSFPNIRLALVVGICGGMPYVTKNEEITLGDVIISDALTCYDFGRQYPQGFKRKTDTHDILGPPSEKTRAFLNKIKIRQNKQIMQAQTVTFLQSLQERSSSVLHAGNENDILYDSSYTHQHRTHANCDVCKEGTEICEDAVKLECEDLGCDPDMRVPRQRLANSSLNQPKIHFGTMGSGNTVLKSGHHRDTLAQREGIVAVEMEGAGIWKYGPTIVIKGVCDYADSHKRKGWQRYAAATAAACTKAFLMEWISECRQQVSVDEVENEYFLVPPQRVKTFFGRENELSQISSYFNHETDKTQTEQPRILALHAIGGQGKTQIALKYCYDTRESYRGVFWVNGISTSAMTQSLANVAQKVDETAFDTMFDDQAKVELALRTLGRWKHRWLMVFDNCDDATTFPELQEKFLPQTGRGHILFTSRHRGLEELARLIEVPLMPQNSAIELLLHRYHDININDYLPEGAAIVDRLGCLALAIDQASAYMQYTRLPITELNKFLPQYLTQRKKVLQHTTPEFWKYTKADKSNERETAIGAFTTWEMSFQQILNIQKKGKHLTHFLTLSAFLAQTAINESLFRSYCQTIQDKPSWMTVFTVLSLDEVDQDNGFNEQEQEAETTAETDGMSDPIPTPTNLDGPTGFWGSDQFWRFLHRAFQMSLLKSIIPATDLEGASFLLHPLIRDWLQLRLAPKQRQMYTREAIDIVVNSIRQITVEKSDGQAKSTVVLHMNAVLACDDEFFVDGYRLGQSVSTYNNASWFASFYRDRGQYDTSLGLYHRLVAFTESSFGMEDLRTLDCQSGIAGLLSYQGKFYEAEQMYRQVLEYRESVLGKEHPDTLSCMSNIATALSDQGKYTEGEQIYREILETRERVLGKEYFGIWNDMSNLATVLVDQSKYSEGEQMHRQVLELSEKHLGREHLHTLRNMNNLAFVLNKSEDRASEVEQMYRYVLESRERILGKEHPDTLSSLSNLAHVLAKSERRTSEVEQMYRYVLESRERILGKEHPQTLISMGNLAYILSRSKERNSEVERIYRHVSESSNRVLGEEHPDTLHSLADLAFTLRQQDKNLEAESVQLRVVETSLTTLGPDHHNTRTWVCYLDVIWEALGRTEAEISEIWNGISTRVASTRPQRGTTSGNEITIVSRDDQLPSHSQQRISRSARTQHPSVRFALPAQPTKQPRSRKRQLSLDTSTQQPRRNPLRTCRKSQDT